MWIALALFSALILGVYDVFKKLSLKGNAVLPVLYLASAANALVFVPFMLQSHFAPSYATFLYVSHLTWQQHALVFLKSCIVGSSWVLNYYAMRYLPISIVSPIRAMAPLFTLLGAVVILGERMLSLQWAGLAVTFAFFVSFSKVGKLEKISFWGNRWMYCVYGGMLLGAASGLYDKYLLNNLAIPKNAVQAWYSVYMLLTLLPVVILKWFPHRKENKFEWRWTILAIGLCLALSDFSYFQALSDKQSLIAIVSALRRCSVVIPFFAGAIFFHEKHIRRKFLLLCGMLAGVALIVYGS